MKAEDTLRTARHREGKQQRVFHPAVHRLMAGLAALLVAVPALAGSVTYTYDSLGRLKTATYSNGVVITYTYDAAGNRTSQVTTGAS